MFKKIEDEIKAGTVKHLSAARIKQIEIPLPPLPIQEKIVEILEKFSLLSAELEAELEGRRKQYDFYRNRLLSFDSGSDSVQWKALGELCTLVTKQTGFDYSNTIKPALLTSPSDDSIPFLQTRNFEGTIFDYNTEYYVPNNIVDKFPKIVLDEKCLLFSIVGASIGNVGLFPAERKCFLGGAICVAKFKPDINIDYVYYVMTSPYGQRLIRNKIKGAGQATVTIEDIRNFVIPLPSSDTQNRIVHLLSRFEKIVADFSEGLPAEIERVQKQYEYYRNKLLTFPEA